MQLAKHHHHFKRSLSFEFDRVERCERHVIDLLLHTTLTDERRESSIAFELMHHHGVAQMARILARQRSLDLDVCVVGSLLHDIEVIVHGTYKDHAHLGAPQAVSIVRSLGGFEPDDIARIHDLVFFHSDKDVVSSDPYIEFGKDADILDIFLLVKDPYAEYLLTKSLPLFQHYLRRAQRVWSEVGLPREPRFGILDSYGPGWLESDVTLPFEQTGKLVRAIAACASRDMPSPVPAAVIVPRKRSAQVFFNSEDWSSYLTYTSEEGTLPNSDLRAPTALLANDGREPTLSVGETLREHLPEPSDAHVENALRVDARPVALWGAIGLYEIIDSNDRLLQFGISAAADSPGDGDE